MHRSIYFQTEEKYLSKAYQSEFRREDKCLSLINSRKDENLRCILNS